MTNGEEAGPSDDEVLPPPAVAAPEERLVAVASRKGDRGGDAGIDETTALAVAAKEDAFEEDVDR
jgi:hypothetical protein